MPRFVRPTLLPLDDRALPSADLSLSDLTTTDFTAFDVRYAVAGEAAPPFAVRAYLSADAVLDAGDAPLSGATVVTDPAGLAVGSDHQTALTLAARAPIREARRFVLLVVDADAVAEPAGAPSRADNVLAAIPLLAPGMTMDRDGTVTPIGAVTDEAGPFTGAILPGTADRGRLVDLAPAWAPVDRFIFGYHEGESEAWQWAEDRYAQPTVVAPLTGLVGRINADRARDPGRWAGPVSINEAYDSLHQHDVAYSRHYEGRALDLSVFDGLTDPTAEARLAGLAWLAGFDFVFNEADHVHVSERAAFPTTLSQQGLQQALIGGFQLGRITNPFVTQVLVQSLDGLDAALRQKNYVRALAQLLVFRTLVQSQAGRTIRDTGFATLLTLNADMLIERTLGEWLGQLPNP